MHGPEWICARGARRLRAAGLLVLLAVSGSARVAHAQVSAEDSALAETLFREAKKLMAQHAYAEACPKLAESERLDPGGGTLLTLALCHEGEGRIATAWAELTDALARAEKDSRPDRIAVARERLSALEARLPRLVVRVPPALAETRGLEIRCDDLALAPAAWGVAFPIDPGTHVVTVAAPGKKPRRTEVVVAEGGLAALDVQELEDAPALSPPAASPPPAAPDVAIATSRVPPPPVAATSRFRDARGVAGITLASAGLVALGVGVGFGVDALSKQHRADALCPRSACADPRAVTLNGEARTSADVATAGFVAGGAAVLGGALLLFLPRATRAARGFTVTPLAARAGGGLAASAEF